MITDTVKIKKNVYHDILLSVGKYEPESGGIIACNLNGDIVDFYFDWEAGVGQRSYVPSVDTINKKINNEWQLLDYVFGGIVHSHPLVISSSPSITDIKMAEKIMTYNSLESMLLIIVQESKLSVWNVFHNIQRECKIDFCKLTSF